MRVLEWLFGQKRFGSVRRPRASENPLPGGKVESAMIHTKEVQWMLRQRPLVHDPEQLRVDYGEEASHMLAAFREKKRGPLLPLLAWPGIATRWRSFHGWLDTTNDATTDLASVFAAFAQYLGRLTSFRALALTEKEYSAIQQLDSIPPSGRLKTDATTLANYVRKEGIRKILYTRMCRIGAFPYDPSLSLHDHPETAVCIAEGYMLPPERLIYRMELDVPMIEVVGWRMCDVDGSEHWFEHRGIWFDTTNPRTERFMLYEIPWFSLRCRSVRVFASHEEVQDYLRPFGQEQDRQRQSSMVKSRV
jgi:hypothetical protein